MGTKKGGLKGAGGAGLLLAACGGVAVGALSPLLAGNWGHLEVPCKTRGLSAWGELGMAWGVPIVSPNWVWGHPGAAMGARGSPGKLCLIKSVRAPRGRAAKPIWGRVKPVQCHSIAC